MNYRNKSDNVLCAWWLCEVLKVIVPQQDGSRKRLAEAESSQYSVEQALTREVDEETWIDEVDVGLGEWCNVPALTTFVCLTRVVLL